MRKIPCVQTFYTLGTSISLRRRTYTVYLNDFLRDPCLVSLGAVSTSQSEVVGPLKKAR